MDKNETYLTEKALAETPAESLKATDALLTSFTRTASRRNMLKGAIATAAGAAIASSPIIAGAVHAESLKNASLAGEIFTVAATAETLAVTFYNHALSNARALGLSGYFYEQMEAIAYEEDIHRSFFIANGGKVLTSTFSFPKGMATFESRRYFVETQQQLEAVFDSAFLLAVKAFAGAGSSSLAQIAAQIACVEQGHLVVGRIFDWLFPAEPYVFAPVLFTSLGQIVPTVTSAGYLSPKKGNSFSYSHARREYVVDTTPGGKTVLNAL